MPGIPPGIPTDGENYVQFLLLVRMLLPRHLSVGIAAPASFWYLKGFPIDKIGAIVDYM